MPRTNFSFLRGTLYYKKPPLLIIELGGIGYECQAPMSTFYQLPEVGIEVFLYTHLVVREDIYGRDARLLAALKSEDRRMADVPVERREASNGTRRPPVMPMRPATPTSFFGFLFR